MPVKGGLVNSIRKGYEQPPIGTFITVGTAMFTGILVIWILLF